MFENNKNTISRIIFLLGLIIMIVAAFVGIFAGATDSYDSTVDWSVALPIWGMGLVCGFLILGFSEVIRLLQDIRDKIIRKEQVEETTETIHNP